MSVASCILLFYRHLILCICTVVCMKIKLKRSPVCILMCVVFSRAILNKYIIIIIIHEMDRVGYSTVDV